MSKFKVQLSAISALLLFSPVTRAQAPATPATQPAFYTFAPTPPMGWNSYDAFGDSVTESEVLVNATYMHDHLLSHGWNYVVIDFRWYDPEPTGDDFALNTKRAGAKLAADNFGRMLPAPNRFPSAVDNAGFKPLADKLHAMGLKFGFHYMRGIPRQSVLANTPIADSQFTAADAANTKSTCGWCPDMFGVQPTAAGQAWYDSLFKLFDAWGLDFVKVDDLSLPYSRTEIEQIRNAIDKCGRPIIFSTSPGPTSTRFADHIQTHANMWRISGDFWDTWRKLNAQFDLLDSWKNTAAPGHWPDADMIPFGQLCLRSKAGGPPHRSRYTSDEQRTLLSLWSLTPSPLMLGNNLPDNSPDDLALLTNDELLAINQDPLGKQATRIAQHDQTEIWLKELSNHAWAVALFNRSNATADVTLNATDAHLPTPLQPRDIWQHKDLAPIIDHLTLTLPPHASALLALTH